MEAKDRIIVALDVDSLEKAVGLVKQLHPYVGGFKIGLELITSVGGPAAIEAVSQAGGAVFYDAKFKDIPNTVEGAVKAVVKPGVKMFNVHCLGGKEMMVKARKAAEEKAKSLGIERPLVLGVTILTSLDYRSLLEVGLARRFDFAPEEQKEAERREVQRLVKELALLAQEAGLDGVVASAQEAELLRQWCQPEFLIVTPAIRPIWAAAGDQKRITTPADAIKVGANYLVIGRPITNPPKEIGSPVEAVKRIVAEIEVVQYQPLTIQEVLAIFGKMGAIYDDDHFVYTKGGHGKAYVNKDDVYVDPDQLSALCKEIAYQSRESDIQVVAGPTIGGVLVAQWVTYWLRRFTGDEKIIAVFADENEEKGSRILKRGYGNKVAGKKVLVVEDVINTGGSAAATVKATLAAGGKVIRCFALCNRSADKKAAAALIGVPVSALLELEMDNFPPENCPYCQTERPINQVLGHGKKFLDGISAKEPEKAEWVERMRKK